MPSNFIDWCNENEVPENRRNLLWLSVSNFESNYNLLRVMGQLAPELINTTEDMRWTWVWGKLCDRLHQQDAKRN